MRRGGGLRRRDGPRDGGAGVGCAPRRRWRQAVAAERRRASTLCFLHGTHQPNSVQARLKARRRAIEPLCSPRQGCSLHARQQTCRPKLLHISMQSAVSTAAQGGPDLHPVPTPALQASSSPQGTGREMRRMASDGWSSSVPCMERRGDLRRPRWDHVGVRGSATRGLSMHSLVHRGIGALQHSSISKGARQAKRGTVRVWGNRSCCHRRGVGLMMGSPAALPRVSHAGRAPGPAQMRQCPAPALGLQSHCRRPRGAPRRRSRGTRVRAWPRRAPPQPAGPRPAP